MPGSSDNEPRAGPDAGAASVFISYASPDQDVADTVCAALEQAGLHCWIAPRDVVPGEFYADAIVHAIDAAAFTVLVLSRHSAASPHVLREVERASSRRHPIVSLRIDLEPLPAALEYFLNSCHWLDAATTGIERALPRLVDAVHRLGAPAPAPAPGPVSAPAPTTVPASGLSATSTIPAVASARARPRGIVVALVAIIVLGLGYVAADKLGPGRRSGSDVPLAVPAPAAATGAAAPVPAAIPENSVAVLPFSDMSANHDQEYFSDGMAEEIIDLLAKVPDLYVPARTSSFYFKGKSEDVPTIAKRLLVAHVLEGSVRSAGRTVRITAQLIRADNGYHVWSETYERRLDDVFQVQDEIAIAVVKALKVTLLQGSLAARARPVNAEAHALYLQGRYYQERDTRDELAKGIAALEQAVRLEPTAAPYWAQLSRAYSGTSSDPSNGWQKLHERALQAAAKALALDPQLPEAHIARAKVAFYLELDFPVAVAEVARAQQLDPTNLDVIEWSAAIAHLLGRSDEAMRLAEKTAALDPLSTNTFNELSLNYFGAGRYADAERAARTALDLNPTTEGAHSTIGLAKLLGGGSQDAALAEIAREPDPQARELTTAIANQILGQPASAAKWLAAHEPGGLRTDTYNIATLHALRGETDQAFAWLDRAYALHDSGLSDVKTDPLLKLLRSDPRYLALLGKLKLPE